MSDDEITRRYKDASDRILTAFKRLAAPYAEATTDAVTTLPSWYLDAEDTE